MTGAEAVVGEGVGEVDVVDVLTLDSCPTCTWRTSAG